MAYCQDKIVQRRHPHSQGVIKRKHGTKARLKPRSEIIKSYNLCPTLVSHSVVTEAHISLERPTPKMLADTPWLEDISLGLVLFAAQSFYQRCFLLPTSINSQGKYYIINFVLPAILSGAACRNPEPAAHCLAS